MAKIHKLRSIRSVEIPVPKNKIQKPKKNSAGEKKKIITKAERDLKSIKCNVLTGDCLNCRKLKDCKEANGNFVQLSNALPYHLLKVLSHPALKLYIYFSARSGGNPKNGNYGKCWPSNAKIHEDTGINKNHVWKYILELEILNLIKTHPEKKGVKTNVRFNYVQWFSKITKIRKLKQG